MSVFATASGIGSWPGTAARPAAEVVVGELGAAMAHLVELPARGVGADIVGRAGALLIDVAIDTVPRGYRVAARPGAVTRRAASLLDEDIDALEEAWEIAGLRGSGRPVKVQAPGPITLAAELELSNGHRAITDPGAFNDIAASLAEGVAAHRASVSRRLDTPVVVQFDEPLLPAAVAGRLTGVTSLSPVAAIEETLATTMLDTCAAAAGCGGLGAQLRLGRFHGKCCRTVILARYRWMSGRCRPPIWTPSQSSSNRDGSSCWAWCRRVRRRAAPRSKRSPPAWWPSPTGSASAVGAAGSHRRHPGCGSGRCDPGWARAAIGLARQAAEAFAADPDAI